MNRQKSIVLIYTRNNYLENMMVDKVPFTTMEKIKELGINLTPNMQNPYEENWKITPIQKPQKIFDQVEKQPLLIYKLHSLFNYKCIN